MQPGNRVLSPGPGGGAKAVESSILPIEFGDFAAETGHFAATAPRKPLSANGLKPASPAPPAVCWKVCRPRVPMIPRNLFHPC